MGRSRMPAAAATAIIAFAALTAVASCSASSGPETGSPKTSAPASASAHPDPTPGPPAAQSPDDRAAALVADMTTAEQAAAVVMGHIGGTDPADLHAYMSSGIAGFILMGSNIPPTPQELQDLTASLTVDESLPPLVAIDQEGGIVSRLPGDTFAASTTLKSLPPEDTAAAFTARGALVADAGINVSFGTVADVTADPGSFIYGRALGTDPASAAERVAAATTAQETYLASTLKHFPGHGTAPGDSHHAIPSTPMPLDQWRSADAVPFAAGVDAGASLLMFGHLAYTSVDPAPASLSPEWHRIAREELDFEGVIVTDDLGMLTDSGLPDYADPVANAVMAIAAGNDLVLMIAGSTRDTAAQIVAGVTAAVEAGTLPRDRLVDAAERVTALRLRLAAPDAE